MTLVVLLSWASPLGVSCSDEACQDRADAGALLLLGLQLVWIAIAVVLWTRRPPLRYWGLVVAAVLPPLTMLVVTGIFYPPDFRF
jgi:hypothetical protein